MDRGDTKRQAELRDEMIKKSDTISETPYIRKILSFLTDTMTLLDIGCGTGHIIQELAGYTHAFLVGMDISPQMIEVARAHTKSVHNIHLVQGDGLNLPFCASTFNVVITRLADYSVYEVYRILKKGGHFLEYGLGPCANEEIVEFFQDRIDEEAFFFPQSIDRWKEEVCQPIEEAGFTVKSIKDYYEKEYYTNEEDLMDLIEMVPLVVDFDREKDRNRISELVRKYRRKRGIEITWHYCIIDAQRI